MNIALHENLLVNGFNVKIAKISKLLSIDLQY